MFLQMNSSVLLMRFDPTSRYLFASTHSCEHKKLRYALTSGIQLTSYTSSHSSALRCCSVHRMRFSVIQCVLTPFGNDPAGKLSISIAVADICTTQLA